jgi:hypothetical protein
MHQFAEVCVIGGADCLAVELELMRGKARVCGR